MQSFPSIHEGFKASFNCPQFFAKSALHRFSRSLMSIQRFASFSTFSELRRVLDVCIGSNSKRLELPQEEQVLYLFINRQIE